MLRFLYTVWLDSYIFLNKIDVIDLDIICCMIIEVCNLLILIEGLIIFLIINWGCAHNDHAILVLNLRFHKWKISWLSMIWDCSILSFWSGKRLDSFTYYLFWLTLNFSTVLNFWFLILWVCPFEAKLLGDLYWTWND